MSGVHSLLCRRFTAVLVVASLLVLPLLTLPEPAGAETPEWVVSSPTTLENQIKVVNANVKIESGGELRLVNSTLVMNCSEDGDYELLVKAGGKLSADRGVITYGAVKARYWFRVAGDLDLQDSEVVGTRGMFDMGGIYITSGKTTINRCRLHDHQWYAVYANGSSPTITGSTFENCKSGVKLDSTSSAVIEGNIFQGMEKEAVLVLNSNPTIRGNTIRDNWRGIGLYNSKATVSGNDITNCGAIGIECAEQSDATVSNNNISKCGDAGISVVSSIPKITGNSILSCGNGINITAAGPAISKNTIAGNRGWGVVCRSGSPDFDGNKFEDMAGNYNTLGGAVVCWRLQLWVQDSAKKPLEGADITVKDGNGNVVFKGKSGMDGGVQELYLNQYRINVSGTVKDTPHKVSVSYRELSDTLTLTMTKDHVYTAKLGAQPKPFLPGMDAPLMLLALCASVLVVARLRRRS